MATYNGFTDSQINCMRIGDLLPNIIMGSYSARKYAEIKLQFECSYANADCDWRADVIDYVPARMRSSLWWDYACQVAEQLRKQSVYLVESAS